MVRTNCAGMSVVGNQVPLGYLFALMKAIDQRLWLWGWSMNEALQVHLIFRVSIMARNDNGRVIPNRP